MTAPAAIGAGVGAAITAGILGLGALLFSLGSSQPEVVVVKAPGEEEDWDAPDPKEAKRLLEEKLQKEVEERQRRVREQLEAVEERPVKDIFLPRIAMEIRESGRKRALGDSKADILTMSSLNPNSTYVLDDDTELHLEDGYLVGHFGGDKYVLLPNQPDEHSNRVFKISDYYRGLYNKDVDKGLYVPNKDLTESEQFTNWLRLRMAAQAPTVRVYNPAEEWARTKEQRAKWSRPR